MHDLVDNVAGMGAVDSPVGQPPRLNVGARCMRVCFAERCWESTVARLLGNVRHPLNAALRFDDPELDAAMNGWGRVGAEEHEHVVLVRLDAA